MAYDTTTVAGGYHGNHAGIILSPLRLKLTADRRQLELAAADR
jgi:hypothetical protein